MKTRTITFKFSRKRIEETYRLDCHQLKLFSIWYQFDYLSREQIDSLWNLITGRSTRYPNGSFSRGLKNNALFVAKTSTNFHKKKKVYLLSSDLVSFLGRYGCITLREEYTLNHTPNYHDYMVREFTIQSFEVLAANLTATTMDLSDFSVYFPRQAKDDARSLQDDNYLFISDCRINYHNTELLLEYDNLTKSTVEHSTKMMRYIPYLVDETKRDEIKGNPLRNFKLLFISRDATVSMFSSKSRKIKTIPATKINKTFDAAFSLPGTELTLNKSFLQIVDQLSNFDLFALPAQDAAKTIATIYLDTLLNQQLSKKSEENDKLQLCLSNKSDSLDNWQQSIAELITKKFNIPGVLSAELFSYHDGHLPVSYYHADGDMNSTNRFEYLITLREYASEREIYIGLMPGMENSFKTIKDFAIMTASYLETYHERAIQKLSFVNGCSAVPMLFYRPKKETILPFTVWDFRKIKAMKQIAPDNNPFLQSTIAVPKILDGNICIEFYEGNSSNPLERTKLNISSIKS